MAMLLGVVELQHLVGVFHGLRVLAHKTIASASKSVPLDKQVDIKKLQKTVMKLPRNLKGPAIADLNFRLKALPQQLQMPKGPVPRSARMPKAPRPRTR